MTQTDLAQRLAKALANQGTDTAFGVPGGGPNLDVVGAMTDVGIRFVLAHGETASCIMASVYGYVSGRVAPTVVTRGPGAASAANGAAQATLDRHPLVLITDTVPASTAARVPHQRLDQRALFAPLCKASATLSGALADDKLDDLLAIASRAPAGAVHLDYDTSDVPDTSGASGASQISGPATFQEGTAPTASQSATRSGSVQNEILAMIAAADRPVVIAGIGATTNETIGSELIRYGAPVFTTYQAIGVVPTEHSCAAGLFTNGASERPLIEQADLIIAVGLDPVEPIPAAWTYDAPMVSLTNTAFADPYFPIAQEAIGDVGELTARLPTGGHRWAPEAGATHRRSVRTALAHAAGSTRPEAITPLELVSTVAEHLPADTSTTVDAGAHFLAIMPFWPASKPRRVLISNGLATMGYALPAAIGASLANPDKPVLCLVGDGGLGMTLAELETVARLDLPVTVVVFNDSALSLIKIKQGEHHGGTEVVSYLRSDFSAVAAGLGMRAVSVSSTDELSAELRTGWEGPRLIDVSVNPNSYPHLIKVTRG